MPRLQSRNMTSTQQDSSDFGACSRLMKNQKTEKQTRRSWSPQEEAALMASLKELVANGWKSDNGFRGGYLAKLEESIGKQFPGTDLKGFPHITSKLQIWKKNYGSLTLILGRNGVGFNIHGNHQIEATKEQWDQIAKCDSNAMSMRQKSWPWFEDWKLIFGKDRATGEGAEDVMDAMKDINQQKEKTPEGDVNKEDDEMSQNPQHMSVDNQGETSTCQSEKTSLVEKSSGKSKKRKLDDPVEKVLNLFLEITRGTHDRLDKIVSRIGYEYDQDEAKKAAFHPLTDIPGLTLKQKFIVSEILVGNHDRLLIFKGLPDSMKSEYISSRTDEYRGALLNQNVVVAFCEVEIQSR